MSKPLPSGLSITKPQLTETSNELVRKPLDLALLRRLLGYLRLYPAMRNWLTFLVILRAVQLPMLGWSIGAIINGPVSRGDINGTLKGALGFGLLALFTQVSFCYRSRLALQIGENVIHDLRLQLFSHLLSMPVLFFNRMKLGRIINRMATDVDAVRTGVQDVLFVGCVQGGQALVAAVMMLWIDWRLSMVVLLMAPIIWSLNRTFRTRLSDANRASQESFSRITATLAESVNGIRITQGFSRQSVNAGLFLDLTRDHSRVLLSQARTSAVFLPLLEFSSQLISALLIFAGGLLVLESSHPVSIGILIQFLFLSGIFLNGVRQLGNLYNNAMMAMAGAERVFLLLDTQPEWKDADDARDLPPIAGRIECRHLTFGYDPARPVLHDLNLAVEPGQTVALVGHTASGKSTLANLIAKFHLPTAGDILIDGVPIRSIRGDSLHRQMAIIHQQNFLFTGTVMDNIRLGRPSATDDDIRNAARRLDCLDLLDALPGGLQTNVGERGIGISLGQRQLVCFVRALLANPRILILDEATSSIDTLTEVRIQKALATLLKGRTCFVIAHRLSTVRNADLVLVMDHGKIIEKGRHLDLLAQRGVYSNLYRQFIRMGVGGTRPPSPMPRI
jgi:ATP-binding cassette subfamily B protein